MKRYIVFIIGFLVVLIAVSLMLLSCYAYYNDSGYYCEYCHHGTAGMRIVEDKRIVNDILGNYPCEASTDSCHHIVYFWQAPEVVSHKYIK